MTAISNQNTNRATVTIEVWSDVVCPWCYIGKRKFASGLAQVEAELAETGAEVDFEPTCRGFHVDVGRELTVPDVGQIEGLADLRKIRPVDPSREVGATEGRQIGDPACAFNLDLAQASLEIVFDRKTIEESRQCSEPPRGCEILIGKPSGEG